VFVRKILRSLKRFSGVRFEGAVLSLSVIIIVLDNVKSYEYIILRGEKRENF